MLAELAAHDLWFTLLKRVITLLLLASFGVHAYVQFRRRSQVPTPERWIFFTFSIALLFGVGANFIAIVLAAKLDILQGPFGTGMFSLLLFFLYLIFAAGVTRRVRYYK